jgi:pimeloyl-ACP methyl ester carboxylesterase
MATYVLVHGGGHGGWCYGRVARILRSAGRDVHAPTLTGLGDRSHLLRRGIDRDTHITDVVAVLHYEDLREVILVGHSYGGMVITGVADRAPSTLATRDPARLEAARAVGRLWDIDTGHDLMITEPEAVAALLLKVAAA